MGLMLSSPAGKVPLGYTDDELNVRAFDERGQRLRPAQRAGLLKLGRNAPCPEGSAVSHVFTARRVLSKRAFVELTGSDQADTVPPRRKVEWTTDLDGVLEVQPMLSGRMMVLQSDGTVLSVNPETGVGEQAFTVPIPVAFSLVPSLGVHDDDSVIVMASYPNRIDGGATRAYRFELDEDGVWQQSYEEVVVEQVIRFWTSDGEVFAATRRPDDVDVGADYSLTRFGGTLSSSWSTLWSIPAPPPINGMAFRGNGVFVAAGPNSSRPVTNVGASVAWTPREIDDAGQRLYSMMSALQLKNVAGLSPGAEVLKWPDARLDASDFEDMVDDTERAMFPHAYQTPPPYSFVNFCPPPTLEADPNGNGFEVQFDSPEGIEAPKLISRRTTRNQGKNSLDEVASWSEAIQPEMGDVAYFQTVLLRLEPSVTQNAAPRDYWVAYRHGKYEIRYRENGADIDLIFDVDDGDVTRTVTLSGSEVYACVTWISAAGANASSVRVNGVQVGAAWTRATNHIQAPDIQTVLGMQSTRFDPTDTDMKFRMRGGVKEECAVLGTGTSPPHGTAPWPSVIDEIEEVEGYQCHAHGLQSILDAGHTYVASPPPSTGDPQEGFGLVAVFQSPKGLLFKLDRSSGKLKWIRADDDCGFAVAVDREDGVYSLGRASTDPPSNFTQLIRVTDDGSEGTLDWKVALDDGTAGFSLQYAAPLYADPCGDVFAAWTGFDTGTPQYLSFLGRFDGADGSEKWADSVDSPVVALAPGGLFVDDTVIGGPCSDQYLLYATRGIKSPSTFPPSLTAPGALRRTDLIGQQLTGETRDQEIEHIAICESGAVSRLVDREWVQVASGFKPGGRPWSFEMFGVHYFGGPDAYKAYEQRFKRVRDWTPKLGSVIPLRIYVAVRWRGRAIVVSEDNPHILFGSAFGDPLDFNTGAAVVTATQAFAGTTAAAGSVPDPITALCVANDDLLYVGTTRSVWRITGDPQSGGQLDDVLATEGILDTFSHCRGDAGEMYWMTTSMRIVRVTPQSFDDISEPIYSLLQKIDPRANRIELHWSQRMRGLYVVQIPRDGRIELEKQHLFWCARTGGWHPTSFTGGPGRAVTCASSLASTDPEGWGVVWGFADGRTRLEHPEAFDDDGVPVPSRMRIPLGGDGDPQKSLVTQAEVVLDPTQGPVMVSGAAARTGDSTPDYGAATMVQPGRADRASVQVAGSHTWLEVAGAGAPWAMDDLAVHIHPWGAA